MEFVEFQNTPRLTIKSSDIAVIKYSIKRRDISQDLVNRELIFEAEVTIKRDDGMLKLYVSSEHTSNETDLINRRIISHLSKSLKDAGVVSSPETEKIKFNLFTNKERILFFKRLTSGKPTELILGNVNNIEVSLNREGIQLPNDPQISWMNDADKRIQIDGKKLNNIFLINDSKYYGYYYILKMEVDYTYSYSANTGNCRVIFLFSNLGKDLINRNDSELSFEIIHIKHKNKVNTNSEKKIRINLIKSIEELITDKFSTTVKDSKKSLNNK